MKPEIKQCGNCRKDFTIESGDSELYQKLSVPLPSFCNKCRLIFRLVWRNERSLHRRKCSLCDKDIIAMYRTEVPFPVYCSECWYSDKWDPMEYGQEYDFSRPFFQQLAELQNRVPRMNVNVINNTNSPYVNNAWNSNNSYMCFDLGYGENVMYSKATHYVKDTVDCSYCRKLEMCYDCIDTSDSSRSIGLENCEGCVNSYFLKNCKNCSDCLLCTNLRNKQYCVLNEQYTKEEYENKKQEYLGSYEKMEKAKEAFRKLVAQSLHKEHENIQVVNCTGNHLWQCKDCYYCFNAFKAEHCRYVNDMDADVKDGMDLSHSAEGERMYNSVSVSGTNLICDLWVAYSTDVYYSMGCAKNNSRLFGCIGLTYKSDCILNRQYTKEEWEELLPRIKKHMTEMPYKNERGTIFSYGDYFPPELSPFAYNETTAQEYLSLKKEEGLALGFQWYEAKEKGYAATLDPQNLPQSINDTEDSIVNQIIGCAHQGSCNHQCTSAFKIIPQELQFYRQMDIPLPRLCSNCRYYGRLTKRTPMSLWRRSCQCAGAQSENKTYQNTISHFHNEEHCPKEFETPYAPDRPEIVYCEQCYQSEVV